MEDLVCGNSEKLDRDDAEEGIAHIQTEMLLVREGD
jgi:hypothetical protein